MKKILLSGMVVLGSLLSAQQLISFETSEGFVAGNIDGQQGWTTTSTGPGNPNIAGQLVTAEQYSDGVQSLKIAKESAYGAQQNPVVGAFKAITSPLDATNFTVSFDVRVNLQSNNSSDFVFRGINTASTPTSIVYYIDFSYDGAIKVADMPTTGLVNTSANWSADTWYRVKIVGTTNGVEYYLNNTLIHTAAHLSTSTQLNRIDFVHDNYNGDGYIDRIAINNEAALSVKETVGNDTAIAIYPNPTTDMLYISSDEKVNGVAIFDMTGRRMNADLKENQVNVNHLEKGNYIITVSTKKGKVSKKFIKK